MRLIALSAVALLASGAAAQAAPPQVSIAVAPELQTKFVKTYGQREADLLTADLKTSVDKALARTGAFQDARIEVTLKDAKPNRPTFKQLADTPGLSMESFGIGGATIEARITAPDGTVTPVSYKWYENDIRWVTGYWTWTDAQWTFDRFARRLAHADQMASR
jgi:hypothetical protein